MNIELKSYLNDLSVFTVIKFINTKKILMDNTENNTGGICL